MQIIMQLLLSISWKKNYSSHFAGLVIKSHASIFFLAGRADVQNSWGNAEVFSSHCVIPGGKEMLLP